MYDFILRFVPINKVQLCLCDTDSCYTLLNSKDLPSAVKEDMKEEFMSMLQNHCSVKGKQRHPKAYLPRTCCDECHLVDTKYPGLWKVEKTARKIIALASKTYICVGLDDSLKISAKGLNKRALQSKQDPFETFKSVLETGQSQGGTNTGFKIVKDKIYTYNCFRSALPFFYIKRECFTSCGSFTRTYENLILNPVPKQYFCIYQDAPGLSLDDVRPFVVDKYRVQTLRQAHCFLKFKNINKDRRDKSAGKCHELFVKLMKTSNPKEISDIERQIEAEDDFYGKEFDIMYNLVGTKLNIYPSMVELLSKAGKAYIVNACQMNARLGTGFSADLTRWRPNAYLAGQNIVGKVYMTYATMLKSTLKG